MSVFGGDSWAREAQQRKRRVEDLIGQGLHRAGDDSNPSYKKLCNGKYACLVCPHHPVLDSTLMLSMHNKGSCHIAAQSRLKEKESKKQEEIRKRIALSDSYFGATCSDTHSQFKLSSKPLIEQTRKATSEALCSQTLERNVTNGDCNVKSCGGNSSFFAPHSPSVFKQRMESPMAVKSVPIISTEKNSGWEAEVASRMLVEQQLEFRERRERELKFTAAGWKRDCHGKWFRDENVEFDSDEEDPNVCLT